MDTRKYLLRAEDIENLDAKEITHFLNPNALRMNKSLGDAVGMSNMGVHMIFVEPGNDTTEFHKHILFLFLSVLSVLNLISLRGSYRSTIFGTSPIKSFWNSDVGCLDPTHLITHAALFP